ncbi:hypothetical protein bcgnr5396_53030 [Bacillus cereus]
MENRFGSWNKGIDVDITHIMARIVVNGKDLPFTSVRTTAWINGPANDLIVTTKKGWMRFIGLCGHGCQLC